MYRKEYMEKYREAHREHIRAYNREYIKAYRKKYGYKWQNLWKKRNKTKVKVHSFVNYLISIGKIQRKPCVVCGSEKVVAYHENYKKPLYIIFMCPQHHSEYHKKNKKNIIV